MSSDLFTPEEMARSLVRVLEITEMFMGPEDWAAWCSDARAIAPEEIDIWVSSHHFGFNMDLRNLFLYPGSMNENEVRPFLDGDPDSTSAYLCRWLTLLARCGGDSLVAARAFLEASGGPPLNWTRRRIPQFKLCADEEL
jgi:hypothetical protein